MSSIPVSGTTSECGSGRVTNGNVPGCDVTVLSNKILFMERVNSNWISLVRALENPSRLRCGGVRGGV